MRNRRTEAERRPPAALYVYVFAMSAGAIAFALLVRAHPVARAEQWGVLPLLGLVLAASEYLFVRFRVGRHVDALNLMEAPLPVLLYAFPMHVAMITIAAAQLAGAILRRNTPVKSLFNISQWTLAAGIGSWVFAGLLRGRTDLRASVAAAFVAVAAMALFNQLAFSIVMTLAQRRSVRSILSGLAPVVLPGWVVGWLVNSLVGILFLLAFIAHPAAVVLFPIPLAMLHFAYRGYAGVRSDRLRLAGLLRAADALVGSIDPAEEISKFLREVATCFEARTAMLVLRVNGGRVVHAVDIRDDTYTRSDDLRGVEPFPGVLMAQGGAGRGSAKEHDELGRALAQAGFRDCIHASLIDRDHSSGVLVVLDQGGLEGFGDGEVVVLDALARHAAALLAKGRLMHTVFDERRKLAEIVNSISDGLFTIDTSGVIQSWNPTMERITGALAAEVVGRPDAWNGLECTDARGVPIDFAQWTAEEMPPRELLLGHRDGRLRRVACSYGVATGSDSSARTLIVVMRDMTTHQELLELRKEATRLALAEAAQRAVVEQLQEAMTPQKPNVPGVDIGVDYVASDPASPTGGDLYDVQELPNGELHVAVVDVVGHGVAASKDALTVMYILRFLAIEGCPLEDAIARADHMLRQLDPELAATVLIARYDPVSGVVRLAGGGHPPALFVGAQGKVTFIHAPGGALGWPGAGSTVLTELRLDRGDRLVLYTDGLVEARRDILEGEDELLRRARSLASQPAQLFAENIISTMLPEQERSDDTLAFVLQRSLVPDATTWTIPPDPEEASRLRRAFVGWSTERIDDESIVGDVALIASELLANALAAARSTITVTATMEGPRVTVSVADDGSGNQDLASLGREHPPAMVDAGRGLFLVRVLSDDVQIDSDPNGTTVTCYRDIVARDSSDRRVSISDTWARQ